MVRRCAHAIFAVVTACSSPSARRPLAQEPIGTGVPGGPVASLPTSTTTSTSSPEPASTSNAKAEPAPSTTSSSSPSGSAPSTVGDLCPPKGHKPDLSRLSTRTGCKNVKQRPRQLADLRSTEQLLASMQPSAPEREEMVVRLAVGYAQLECSIAAACAKARDTNATPDEITIVEAKKKTDEYCSMLKSDFPKSKRQCP
jgi:hypothetical protein